MKVGVWRLLLATAHPMRITRWCVYFVGNIHQQWNFHMHVTECLQMAHENSLYLLICPRNCIENSSIKKKSPLPIFFYFHPWFFFTKKAQSKKPDEQKLLWWNIIADWCCSVWFLNEGLFMASISKLSYILCPIETSNCDWMGERRSFAKKITNNNNNNVRLFNINVACVLHQMLKLCIIS